MARLEPRFVPAEELSVDDIAALVDLGLQQVELMDLLEVALQANDTLRALDVARELVGLERQIKQ
jgi:hypothetical protein